MTGFNVGLLGISGFNTRAVVALARDCDARGVSLHLVARDNADPIFQTSHAGKVFARRTTPDLQVEEVCGWLEKLREQHGYACMLLVPSTEFFNRFLLQHRGRLAASGGVLPLVEQALYERISDKHSFGQLCREHGLDVPAEFAQRPEDYPFVAKPLRYASTDGRQLKPHLIHDASDWAAFSQAETETDFYFQEFVNGRSLYLLLHLARDGTTLSYSQENLIQQKAGGSIILARRSDLHKQDVARRYIDMLRREGFYGLVMIEVRHDAQRQRHVMIEANPRLWGPMQFALDNGIDLFGALLRDALALPAPALPALDAPGAGRFYFWSGGLTGASQPYAFHGFTAQDFLDDYARIAACDLFNRDDSRTLHRQELQH